MPVDEDINLDSPDGITSEQIDEMNAEADRLEQVAERTEKSIKKVKDSTKDLNFAQMNILEGATSGDSARGNKIGDLSQDDLVKLVVELMEKSEDAEQERKTMQKKQKTAKEERDELKAKMKRIEMETIGDLKEGEGKFYESLGALNNPISFGKGKVMSYVGKAGIAGAIIMMIYKMGEFLYKQWEDSFKAGGTNDIRKLVDDRTREIVELNDMLERRNGRVFFSGDVNLQQGAPQISNTERLRDQVLRYQALHLGE